MTGGKDDSEGFMLCQPVVAVRAADEADPSKGLTGDPAGERYCVPGGWIYRIDPPRSPAGQGESMCVFVPDPSLEAERIASWQGFVDWVQEQAWDLIRRSRIDRSG